MTVATEEAKARRRATHREYNKKWRAANPEKVREQNRRAAARYYAKPENREKRRVTSLARYHRTKQLKPGCP